MIRTSLIAILVFVAGLAIGSFARGAVGTLQQRYTHKADLAAIEKLHQADIDATLTQDLNALTTLWSDEAVNLGFPGPPVVGIKAMKEAYEKFKVDYPEFKVLRYVNVTKEVQIADDWAIELSDSEATYKMSAKESPVSVPRTRGMRLLKRQSDGSWKFALVGMK